MSSYSNKTKRFQIYGDASVSRSDLQWICDILNDSRSWTSQLQVRKRIPKVVFEIASNKSSADWNVSMKTNSQIIGMQPSFDGLSMTQTTRDPRTGLDEKVPLTIFNRDNWERPPTVSSQSSNPRAYQVYLVNHEFGHVLGQGHRACLQKNRKVPVMVQQTKGISDCQQNPWPLDFEVDSVQITIR